MKTEVLIIGGGVAGLTLAIKLAKRGVFVTLVEKDPTLGKVYKGELVQPKTIQIFDRMGMLQALEQLWNPFSDIDTRELLNQKKTLFEKKMTYRILPEPYNYAAMIPHSVLKDKLLQEAKGYHTFTNIQPAIFKEMVTPNKALVKRNGELIEIIARYIVGAEGIASKVRTYMNVGVKKNQYNHDFLTVSFPKPHNLISGKMIATDDRFLGLFPLPDNQVRTVYLVRKGEFKQWRKGPIDRFYQHYLSLYPELDGYVQKIQSWKAIQLMVPIRQHANNYVKNHFAIIGDAAHSVHPMAGEGMNLAIQDADILGELIGDMYEKGVESDQKLLLYYEKVRRERAIAIIAISHLSGLAYGKQGMGWQKRRVAMLRHLIRRNWHLGKYMFNVSGLGIWYPTIKDGWKLIGKDDRSSLNRLLDKHTFSEEEDYPWKEKMR